MNGSNEYVQLIKLHALFSNTDTTTKEIYMFLKENINVFTCIEFQKHVLKESLMLLMILDDSSEETRLILDVIFQILNFRK